MKGVDVFPAYLAQRARYAESLKEIAVVGNIVTEGT
jgi:hypothetical protein